MGGRRLSKEELSRIKYLKSEGYTLLEIKKILKVSKNTVYRYSKNIKVKPEFLDFFESKRFSSRYLSKQNWEKAKEEASAIFANIKCDIKPLVLACLYWGEGNKKELNLINSDPMLVKTFVNGLYSIGVEKKDLLVTLRVYEDNNVEKTKLFWINTLDIEPKQILNINVLNGKKKGKLEFGMCRVRVRKGGRYFKLISSMIDFLKISNK